MKITRISLYRYNIPLKAPIAISLGTIDHARNILVEIQTDAGITGWGEGSPFWMIVGETQASGLAAAEEMARLLLSKYIGTPTVPGESIGTPTAPGESIGTPTAPGESIGTPTAPGESTPGESAPGESIGTPTAPGESTPGESTPGCNPLDIEGCIDALIRYLPGHPTTRSAFDMALYDIAAKAANMPLHQFLGGSKRPLITDETIYINSPERMVADALRMVAKGAEAIKVKLGTNVRDDIRRVEAIRNAIGDATPIRTDANQGWDVVSALAVLRAIGNWNVQYCEQPIPRHDVAGLRHIRQHTTVPIMADESLFGATDALRLVRNEAVDYFNIKLSKSGGIFEALKINAIAEAAGVPCMIGCMSESRLALTANAHFAAARKNVCFCDLDAHFEHAHDPVQGGIVYNGYHIELPDTPGIGATVDPAFLATCQRVDVS